ncbi:RNA polymerase sigma factor [Clostridium paraputrificum]|uniref:RNA polymerase sigma factor n=1 Tax=Clostridium paraputrificum TaxID=29363 RepID=UPI003D34D850
MHIQDEIETIYYTYSDDVYHYLLSMSRNPDIAEDILQNTFMKVMNGIATFKGNSSLKTWIFTIARNEYFHYLKKSKSTVPLDEGLQIKDNIYDNYENKEKVEEILNYIDKLEEPYRSLMVLRLVNDITFREIAIILNKTESWARVTFMRYKCKLVQDLKEEL